MAQHHDMPRACRHVQPGHTKHVTHRCHSREFLLRFARDRQAYNGWLREGLRRFDVRLLTYCVTGNHVHLLIRSPGTVELARFMQLVAGGMAPGYNARKKRSGACWADRYHATMIEAGAHLWRCLRYIDLNMVRAGAVRHPSEWAWTGWLELMGQRGYGCRDRGSGCGYGGSLPRPAPGQRRGCPGPATTGARALVVECGGGGRPCVHRAGGAAVARRLYAAAPGMQRGRGGCMDVAGN